MKLLDICGGKQAIVDDDLYDKLKKFSWRMSHGYVRTDFRCPHGDRTTRSLHQIVYALNNQTYECDTTYTEYGLHINHKNWDRLDNRLDNLELISAERNNQMHRKKATDASGYRGVYKKGNKWYAQIRVGGKKIYLGAYPTETAAALKYNDYIYAHKMDRELNPVNYEDWRDENIIDS